MSLEKCLHFLSTGSIFLARYDSFEDKYEGHSLEQLASELDYELDEKDRGTRISPEKRKKVLFGSCWYKGGEDLTMWDRFRSNQGIALQVRVRDLSRYFKDYGYGHFYANHNHESEPPRIWKTYSGSIKYLVKRKDKVRYRLGLIKHPSFIHEKEYRFVVRQKITEIQPGASSYLFKIPGFDRFEATIITNPYMEISFKEMLESYVEKLGLGQITVSESEFRDLFHQA